MKKHKTFCAALLNNIRYNNDLSISPCCVFSPEQKIYDKDEYVNSDYMRDIIHRVIDGEKVKECSHCWKRESNDLRSHREIYNEFYFESGISEKLAEKAKDIPITIRAVDLKVGNRCNFACAMCKPSDSSRIEQFWNRNPNPEFSRSEIDTRFVRDNNIHLLEKTLQQDELKNLKVLGGEPLLDKDVVNLLANQTDERKSKLNLNIVTNGSIDLNETCDKLGGYRRINLSVSLEGIGAVQDYIRFGSKWNEIEKNILSIRDRHGVMLEIEHMYQALNFSRYLEFTTWLNKHELYYSLNPLTNPPHLSLNALPEDFVKKYIDSIPESIVQYSYDERLQEQFCRYIRWYESYTGLDMKDHIPEIYEEIIKK